MYPFFPQRGWTQVSLGVGAPALCHRHGEGSLPTPSALPTWVVLSKKVIPPPLSPSPEQNMLIMCNISYCAEKTQ